MYSDQLNNDSKEKLIQHVWANAKDVQYKIQSGNDEGKQWLIEHSPTAEIAIIVKDMTTLMLHVLEAIGQLEPVNGITISKQFGVARGSVSKTTKKLVEKELVVMETLPENKKEILFQTTTIGKAICRLHQALHQELDQGIYHFLQQYTEEELETTQKVLHDVLHTSWLNTQLTDEPTELSKNTRSMQNSPATSDDIQELLSMLQQLDARKLKKATVILKEIFFNE